MKVIKIVDLRKSVEEITEVEELGAEKSETSGGKKGVNKSFKITNKNGESFLWKPSSGEHTSAWRYIPAHTQYKRERAAYLIDQRLGFGLVPETKIMKFRDSLGSMHSWKDAKNVPDKTLKRYSDDTIWKLGLLDMIVGNSDRHSGNWLEYDNGDIVAIDHGYCFPTKEGKDDSKSKIVSRFALKIKDKKIPERYLFRVKKLRDDDIIKHIKSILEPAAFSLYNKRVEELINTGVADIKEYQIVAKLSPYQSAHQ